MLHEIIKLLHYAGAKDSLIIRIGTSGGIGEKIMDEDKSKGSVLEYVKTCIVGFVIYIARKSP